MPRADQHHASNVRKHYAPTLAPLYVNDASVCYVEEIADYELPNYLKRTAINNDGSKRTFELPLAGQTRCGP